MSSVNVKLVSGYRLNGVAQYLGYTTDRVNGALVNVGAYLNDGPAYSIVWRLTEYKDSVGTAPSKRTLEVPAVVPLPDRQRG